MVFDAVQRHSPRGCRGNVLGGVFLAVSVDVNVKPLLGHIVAVFAVGDVMIVPNDGLPLAATMVLELDHEPRDAVLLSVESDSNLNRPGERAAVFAVVLARRVAGHSLLYRHVDRPVGGGSTPGSACSVSFPFTIFDHTESGPA